MRRRYVSARKIGDIFFTVETLKPRVFYRYKVGWENFVGFVARASGKWLWALEKDGKFLSSEAGYEKRLYAEKRMAREIAEGCSQERRLK